MLQPGVIRQHQCRISAHHALACRPGGTVNTGYHHVGLQVRSILDMQPPKQDTPAPTTSLKSPLTTGMGQTVSLPNMAALDLDAGGIKAQVELSPSPTLGGAGKTTSLSTPGEATTTTPAVTGE